MALLAACVHPQTCFKMVWLCLEKQKPLVFDFSNFGCQEELEGVRATQKAQRESLEKHVEQTSSLQHQAGSLDPQSAAEVLTWI